MARQEVCHGLRDGACHREPAAVAQPQDKAAQAAARRPAWPHAAGAPSVLGTRAGGKSQVEASRVPLGADGAPGGVAQGGAVRKAMRAQALAPLSGCSGLARPHAANLLLTRSELAGARAGLPGPAGLLGSPGGPWAGLAGPCLGTLRGVQPLARVEVFALAAAVRVAHANPSQRRAHTALLSTGASSAATGEARVVALRGAAARAQPGESGR